jgi:hypothetical protein
MILQLDDYIGSSDVPTICNRAALYTSMLDTALH